jgi:hypothetical protein
VPAVNLVYLDPPDTTGMSAVKIYNNKKTNNLISEINKESSGYIGDVSSNRTNNSTRKRKRT